METLHARKICARFPDAMFASKCCQGRRKGTRTILSDIVNAVYVCIKKNDSQSQSNYLYFVQYF